MYALSVAPIAQLASNSEVDAIRMIGFLLSVHTQHYFLCCCDVFGGDLTSQPFKSAF
jgi:hypothetical protein